MAIKSIIQDDPAAGFELLPRLLRDGKPNQKAKGKPFDYQADGVVLAVCLYQRSGNSRKLLKRLDTREEIEQELMHHPHIQHAPQDGQHFYEYRFYNPSLSGQKSEKGVNVSCSLNHPAGIGFR